MDPLDKRFVIGIDLGTTNSALSYVDFSKEEKRPLIRIFRVPQLTGAGEISSLPVLPSFHYIPGTYDISADATRIPWEPDGRRTQGQDFVGRFARDHGAKVPARLVSSAKSWLCHPKVDRRAKILPWGAPEEVAKISPVQATASYLAHLRKSWNSTRGDDSESYLENQVVVITVPASFDEVARDLTVEAATMAGFKDVTLLEEPLAAFYSWLNRYEDRWAEAVRPGELILVCDVGGGTTDFTLITLRDVQGSPRFERIAVGDHLILGGDNMDLALARSIETGPGKSGQSLTVDRFKALCHQCRQAKEQILDGRAQSRKITLMGEGRALIAGTLSADLKRADVQRIVLDGFFPILDAQTIRRAQQRKGITEFGLPYESEPAITQHLGWFLDRHRGEVQQLMQRQSHAPDWILFNGGSLKPRLIQDRIRESIRSWFSIGDTDLPRVLDNPDPDLAVALGAAYYGLVKTGRGVRVGSGSPRAYYLGIARDREAPLPREAICLVERGLEEGSGIVLSGKSFEVLTNQPVTFDIFSSSFRSGDRCADVIPVDDSLTALPPIQTVIQYGKKGQKTQLPVLVEGRYTEMGTLALWCRSQISPHRWQLQFQLRDTTAPAVADIEVFEERLVTRARAAVIDMFQSQAKSPLSGVIKTVAEMVDRSKERWPLGFIRALVDDLIDAADVRQRSAEHEARWLNLTGFCLRPGIGDGFDAHRLQHLWKLYKPGPVFVKAPQVRSEWLVFWRRVAAGLKAGQQRQIFQDWLPAVAPKKGAKSRLPVQEHAELWMALANMELLAVKDKIRLGDQLVAQMGPKWCRPQLFWALSRLGARQLLYGPTDRVVSPEAVAVWIEALMGRSWPDMAPVAAAVAQMARLTGDRVQDLDEVLIQRILDWMDPESFAAYRRYLTEVVAVADQEESRQFGESLPSGIVLK